MASRKVYFISINASLQVWPYYNRPTQDGLLKPFEGKTLKMGGNGAAEADLFRMQRGTVKGLSCYLRLFAIFS